MDASATNRSPLQPMLTALINNRSVSTYIQGLLFQSPLFLRFRPDVELCFATKRTLEFSQVFRVASFLWLALYVVIFLGTLFNFDYVFKDTTYGLWQSVFATGGIIVASLNICAYIPKTHVFVHRYLLAPATALLLYQMLVASIAHNSNSPYASYNIIIFMTLIAHSLRFFWQKSLQIFLYSGALAAATAFIKAWPVLSLQALHAYVLIGVVLLNIAFFVERRERLSFLHEILATIKSTELERLNTYLAATAGEDAVSGLANRRAFDQRLEAEWVRARREEQPMTLLFINIDHFKPYYSAYGQAAGDDCLRQISHILKKALLRPADIIARYSDDEFVVLLPCTDALGAEEVAERMIRMIDTFAIPHKHSPLSPYVTISLGICTMLPNKYNHLSLLVENADAALYKAKTAGHHCYRHYIEPNRHLGFRFHS